MRYISEVGSGFEGLDCGWMMAIAMDIDFTGV